MAMKIYSLVELRYFSWNYKFGGCMAFGAGGKGAQTCPLVHVSSPAYNINICSATWRRNISSKVDVSMNI